eukprot:2015096-Pyramimonas_sp.AAC.1
MGSRTAAISSEVAMAILRIPLLVVWVPLLVGLPARCSPPRPFGEASAAAAAAPPPPSVAPAATGERVSPGDPGVVPGSPPGSLCWPLDALRSLRAGSRAVGSASAAVTGLRFFLEAFLRPASPANERAEDVKGHNEDVKGHNEDVNKGYNEDVKGRLLRCDVGCKVGPSSLRTDPAMEELSWRRSNRYNQTQCRVT